MHSGAEEQSVGADEAAGWVAAGDILNSKLATASLLHGLSLSAAAEADEAMASQVLASCRVAAELKPDNPIAQACIEKWAHRAGLHTEALAAHQLSRAKLPPPRAGKAPPLFCAAMIHCDWRMELIVGQSSAAVGKTAEATAYFSQARAAAELAGPADVASAQQAIASAKQKAEL